MKKTWVFALVAGAMIALSAASFAAGNSAPRGVALASRLGVGLDELVACANSASGQATQTGDTDAARSERQALVLACLQSDHPQITAAEFQAATADVTTAAR